MKKSLYIIAALLFSLTGTSSAGEAWQNDWKEKMMSEKIAFFTVEMGLTPEEAQVFWPVYNAVNKEKDAAMHNVFRTFRALEEALENNKPQKEVSKLLEDYLEALETQRETDAKAADKFRKVLPEDKLAKLYISEEKFRRQHIRKLHKPEAKK